MKINNEMDANLFYDQFYYKMEMLPIFLVQPVPNCPIFQQASMQKALHFHQPPHLRHFSSFLVILFQQLLRRLLLLLFHVLFAPASSISLLLELLLHLQIQSLWVLLAPQLVLHQLLLS